MLIERVGTEYFGAHRSIRLLKNNLKSLTKMRPHYSSSKLVNWLRTKVFNVKKPIAASIVDWEEWTANLKKNRPVAYFFTEQVPDAADTVIASIVMPWHDARIYLSNRFITKTHYLPTHLPRGKWAEFDQRLMHGMFGLLVDYVEIELAHDYNYWCNKKDQMPIPWKHRGICKLIHGTYRNPTQGLAALYWALGLTNDEFKEPDDSTLGEPSQQAINARETLELYTWWTVDRAARIDAWEASGMASYWASLDSKYSPDAMWAFTGKISAEEEAQLKMLHDKQDRLESEYDAEDTAMMIRLIKLRQALWT